RYYCAAERLLSVAGDSNDPWFQKDRNGKKLRSQPYPLPPFEHTAADGPMIAAFEKNGMPFAPMPVARYRRCMTTGTCKYCPIGARFLAASIFDELVESKRHPNLHVQVRSPVSQLLMHGKNRIAGVGYLDTATGHTRKAFAERVIVCSGAYESPKLLLRSQSTHWPNGVGNTYEHVGRYLISHPLLFVRGKTADNPHRLQQELDFPTLMSRHYDNPDEQRDGKLFVYRERTRPRVDLAKHMIAGLERTAIENIVKGPADWEIQGFMEEFANENNRIQLGDGLNRLGLPQTRLRFHRAPGFTEASQRHLGRMRKILEDMNVVVNEVGVLSQRGDHAAATCRMSMCEKTGVVDKNLRVHAVDNLYVCSNAVFPSGAAVNPTLTVTALSLRLAEHLASSFPAVQRAAAQQAAVRGAVQHVGAGQEGQ
ncbi:MAG TPA: GMC family oxidoreductase, partial [Pirellulales bacterium]